MVVNTASLTLAAGKGSEWRMDAFCMNIMCGCPSDRPMYLTDLYMPVSGHKHCQGNVWNKIGASLRNYTAKYGDIPGAPGHGKGKKKKK